MTTTATTEFDAVAFIMAVEDQSITDEAAIVAGVQKLVDSGMLAGLQGGWQQLAKNLIAAGKVKVAPKPEAEYEVEPFEPIPNHEAFVVVNETRGPNGFGLYAFILVSPKGEVWDISVSRFNQELHVGNVIQVPIIGHETYKWTQIKRNGKTFYCEAPTLVNRVEEARINKAWRK